ncbi:MAG: uncharacterized protein KVP18_002441, partial [Porospora cf. gigantea A]|uniref:uncharacterized protein n=1 Tax=Porospora cf. gigantea A TaxID=2853593 RepID=UPI0035595D78
TGKLEEFFSQLDRGIPRLIVRLDDLSEVDGTLSQLVVSSPYVYLAPVVDAVASLVKEARGLSDNHPLVRFSSLGLCGWLGRNHVTPRGLNSALCNRVVCVEGILTRVSSVSHRNVQRGYSTVGGENTFIKLFPDPHSVARVQPAGGPVPLHDQDGRSFEVDPLFSLFKDAQFATVQETPECAPHGLLPRSVDVVFEHDLVDRVKPGNRVRCYGVFRTTHHKVVGKYNGYCRPLLIVNNVERIGLRDAALSPKDVREIKSIAGRKDALAVLSRSVAPSIFGREMVKRGLLLQLVGGEPKHTKEGTRIRGDIHVMLIGDPSCGKSQMLRFVLNTAPVSISTSGKGSSGVGLTAAVVSDRDTGHKRLEAGATVLADNGFVCIDEFDKMGSDDRVAIHEVMEQQTVSISKASIQARLNARCSVLAAANPCYGVFDESVDLRAQLSFPDSLLSRFDLMFVVRDSQLKEEDRRISSQVLQQHQGYNKGSKLTAYTGYTRGMTALGPSTEGETNTEVWAEDADGRKTTLSHDFLKKYIQYAKRRPAPVLTSEAASRIADFYCRLRQRRVKDRKSAGVSLPTARTLEACVRLATAHAKLKLKDTIGVSDAQIAIHLLRYSLFGEDHADDDSESELSDSPQRKRGRTPPLAVEPPTKRPETPLPLEDVNEDVLTHFRQIAGRVRRGCSEDFMDFTQFQNEVNNLSEKHYTREAFDMLLTVMTEENNLMWVSGTCRTQVDRSEGVLHVTTNVVQDQLCPMTLNINQKL